MMVPAQARIERDEAELRLALSRPCEDADDPDSCGCDACAEAVEAREVITALDLAYEAWIDDEIDRMREGNCHE